MVELLIVLAVPVMSFFAGYAAAAKRGVLDEPNEEETDEV